jgi:heat-inducible transcriptional repressor
MSDLEYLGYINHPHTSAGRVPTDLGYRFYLDTLMQLELVSESDRKAIRQNLDKAEEAEALLRESSRLLGRISRQLCVVTSPDLSSGIFEKIELVQVTGTRVMAIISIKAGLVRTIMLEVASEIPREKLEEMGRLLNERLSGLTLHQVRDSFAERVRDVQTEDSGLIRLFIDSVDKLFVPTRNDRIHIAGAEMVVEQPEFVNPEDFKSVIELINNEEIIVHVLEKNDTKPPQVKVTIGEENADEKLRQYSVITASYSAGDVTGSVGVIGPRRMQYAKMIPLVDEVARAISMMFTTTLRS